MSILSDQRLVYEKRQETPFASMTPRDRMPLLGTGVAFHFFVMVTSIIFMSKALKDLKTQIQDSKQAYSTLQQEQGGIGAVMNWLLSIKKKLLNTATQIFPHFFVQVKSKG